MCFTVHVFHSVDNPVPVVSQHPCVNYLEFFELQEVREMLDLPWIVFVRDINQKHFYVQVVLYHEHWPPPEVFVNYEKRLEIQVQHSERSVLGSFSLVINEQSAVPLTHYKHMLVIASED